MIVSRPILATSTYYFVNAFIADKCIGPYYGGCDHTRECLNARDSVNCSACLPGQNLVSIQGETSCASEFWASAEVSFFCTV